MTIKYERAKSLASTGVCHQTYYALSDHMPRAVYDALPARLVAEMMDGLFKLAQESKAIHAQEVIAEAGIWDNSLKRFRPLT